MSNKYQETAIIKSQEQIGQGIFRMYLQTKQIAAGAVPGQFVSVYCKDSARLLPRPISICDADPKSGLLCLVYRVAGAGTAEFSAMKAGDELALTGPLGNGYPLDKAEGKRALLIGGGIGIPPLHYLARTLKGEKCAVLGYRSELFLKDDFAQGLQVPTYIATEDGSAGAKGTVLDCIREYALEGDIIYACGPTPMLKALKEYAAQKGMECYLSLEQRMACGVGACLACVCGSTQVDAHSNVHNKRVCVEGPVFEAGEIIL